MPDERPAEAARRSRQSRAHGRELALLALCHLESYRPDERPKALEIFWTHAPAEAGDAGTDLRAWLADADAVGFARDLLAPILARGPELDAILEATSRSWRVARMDRVDRNVLRLVAAELSPRPGPSAGEPAPAADLSETPRGVVLAEAVRLASRYGSERSAAFVNGVAEALARKLRPA
jgi:N utilization substance protein B